MNLKLLRLVRYSTMSYGLKSYLVNLRELINIIKDDVIGEGTVHVRHALELRPEAIPTFSSFSSLPRCLCALRVHVYARYNSKCSWDTRISRVSIDRRTRTNSMTRRYIYINDDPNVSCTQ